MEDSSAYNVPAMAYVLQSRMSTVQERITALRSLKEHLEDNKTMDAYSQKRIKQLILDNVLQMILSEEKVTNVVKRQMVRTELFLILSKLLESSVLFGSIFGTEQAQSGEGGGEEQQMEGSPERRPPLPGGSRVLQPPGGWVKRKLLKSRGSELSSRDSALQRAASGHSTFSQSHSAAQLPPGLGSLDAERAASSNSAGGMRKRTASQSAADLTLLKPLLHKQARSQKKSTALSSLSSKTWKPRPSILHSELVADSFVPGADPLNYFEQDRKLGYQKPRMWFPGAMIGIDRGLVPDARQKRNPGGSEQVVREFLQMRSLASYVGDLVAPYVPAAATSSYMAGTSSPAKPGSAPPGAKTTRFTGLTDNARFAAALKEVAAVWTPLLGVHLPSQDQQAPLPGTARSSRKRKLSTALNTGPGTGHNNNNQYQEYAQEIVPFKCLRVSASAAGRTSRNADGDQSFTASTRLDAMTATNNRYRTDGIDEDGVASADNLYYQRTQQYQQEVSAYLQAQREHVSASIRASEKLIAATMQSVYHMFKPKYLLLLEGKKANSRALIASAMVIFCRVKRSNLLALAFGTWKILLVLMASVARRPLYSRTAACYLMARWQQEVHLKKLRVWIVRWRRRAGVLIFIQRNQEVVRIQTLYRTWRDRRKFIAMHTAKTFQGVLSDVYLAPKRKNLPFFVPDIIRSDRRLLWLAATIIQTVFRCYIASKDFFYKRRMILLIQSIIRMFPRYQKYKRLRATTIKCQAWARRTVKRVQYKRLKRATIIVQKYVRRYLGILRKLRTFDRIWREGAEPLAAAIMIQCRYRIRLAKRKLRGKRFVIAKRKYAALVIQRNYYRYKRAFHTFFLMCCLRERETQDLAEIRRKTLQSRAASAAVIQRFYKERYFRRNLGAIVKVQCWFRGRMGYGLVDILRKERWASRKLRAWAKVRVRRRRRMARVIQRWWWRCVEGRLRKHLWWRLKLRDEEEDRQRSERRHFASMRIQAYVKGVWDRRWVKRLRAALIIQRNARFYFGLKRWRRWKKDKIMKVVRRYATYVEERAVKNVLARILRKHSDNMRKPQALARGFIVRTIMRRAKWMAYRIGIAVVRIQRFWRQTGAMGKAVEEVMVLRRERSNPFVPCRTIHEVLLMMRRQTKPFFSCYDPRVGLRVSALMYRLGCPELADMFPRKHYVTVSDMAGLGMHKVQELYESWKSRAEKGGGNKDKGSTGSVKVKKKQPPPTQLFETLLGIVNPPLFTTHPKHREKIKTIMALPEYESPARAMEGFKKTFQRKFGKNLNARAEHMAKDLLQMVWGDFNNYKTVGAVLTKHHIVKAISSAPESNNPLQLLDEIRTRTTPVVDEKKWDRERIAKTAEFLQLAVDRLLVLMPPGRMRTMVERANNKVVSYRRKMVFIRQRLTAPAAPARRASVVSNSSDISNVTPVKKTGPGAEISPITQVTASTAAQGTPTAPVVDAKGVLDLTSSETLNQVLPVPRSVDLPFNPANVAELELESDVSICRVFFDALDRLYMMTAAVQSLKNSWYNNTLKRSVARAKIEQFKNSVKAKYLRSREEDKVKLVWMKNKRMETSKKKLDVIMKAVIARKAGYKFELSFIPRYGWVSVEDANGYAYWMDTKPRGAQESTYDMPVYTVPQYFLLLKMQKAARLYLERIHARKRQREAEALAEVARLEALMEEERKKGARVVKTRISLVGRLLESAAGNAAHKPHHHGHPDKTSVPTIESMLPWCYRFYDAPVFLPGFWALLRLSTTQQAAGEDPDEPKHLVSQYDIVTVFRIKESEGVCDVRSVKGKFHRNVRMNRLFVMHLDCGTVVESRYKQEQVFYRCKITHIDANSGNYPLYSIRYEDGETATGLRWDAIRPTSALLRSFLLGREKHLRSAMQRHRRLEHFHRLRLERIRSYEERMRALMDAQLANNPGMKFLKRSEELEESRPSSPLLLGDGSRPESPMLGLEDGSASRDVGDLDAEGKSQRAFMPTVTSTEVALVTRASTAAGETAMIGLGVPRYRIDIKLRFPYSRVCNRFGWKTFQEVDFSGRPYSYYVNERTDETVDVQPAYTAMEVQSAQRIQLAWLGHRARCKVYLRVVSLNMTQLIRDTIKKCAQIAYIGYELEGVTPMQTLRRAGYWELADTFEAYYKGLKWNIANLSLQEIARRPRDEYESMGVTQPPHQRDLKEFQTWWNRSNNAEKQKRLTLFDYYKSADDPRDIKTCIKDAEELMVAKFMKYIKAGAARTRAAVEMVTSDSHFPHAHMQVETYLKKYGDKAEMARDSVLELVNKPTTHTYVEEKVVLRHYRNCARLIRGVLASLKLRSLRNVVARAEKSVEAILKTAPTGSHRVLCTGPEAKAALLLRTKVLQYILSVSSAVEVIQRNVRCYLLSKKWSIFLVARTRGIDKLQRAARRYLARKIHRTLTAQKWSEWEQLWDSRRNLLYYYNHTTGVSQYNEPDCPFRPLVRDPLSSALIQAWPDLDNRGGVLALLPPSQSTAIAVPMQASHTHCGICQTRKCVRICTDCTDEVHFDPAKYHMFPYCFTCYMKEHPEDNAVRANHQFSVVGEGEASSALEATSAEQLILRCCMCEEPATRKCQGLVDEDTIENICADLKRTSPDGWMDVLRAANVAGDRKLTLLLDQIRSESSAAMSSIVAFQSTEASKDKASPAKAKHQKGKTSPLKGRKGEEPPAAPEPELMSPSATVMLSVSHLQAVRTLLERSRAECDECYCAGCYKEVHAGGKRALHKWKGFQARAQVCSVCTNCPAELNCFDCECKYCASCYKVFHGMGRKRNHKRERLLEELKGEGSVYCGLCERRPADTPCDNGRCHMMGCDSCVEFRHKPQCRKELVMFAGGSPSGKPRGASVGDEAGMEADGNRARTASGEVAVKSNAADTDPDACVVCGEEADQKCTQCGDCYCSRTWMGNPGCFAQHHSKGNRAAHTTELHMSRRALVASMKRSRSMRQSRKNLLAADK